MNLTKSPATWSDDMLQPICKSLAFTGRGGWLGEFRRLVLGHRSLHNGLGNSFVDHGSPGLRGLRRTAGRVCRRFLIELWKPGKNPHRERP